MCVLNKSSSLSLLAAQDLQNRPDTSPRARGRPLGALWCHDHPPAPCPGIFGRRRSWLLGPPGEAAGDDDGAEGQSIANSR
jgi:hypothetical protein